MKFFSTFSVALAAMSSLVSAVPVPRAIVDTKRTNIPPGGFVPINNFSGIKGFNGNKKLDNFDLFFGVDNFNGHRNQFNFVDFNNQLAFFQCRAVDIRIIQQQLAVVIEFMKQIVLVQVCEVDIQVILIQQFISGINLFGRDIRRQSGRPIGFDKNVAVLITQIIQVNTGLLVQNPFDLGFNGHDIGRFNNGFVGVVGDNWNDQVSPPIVEGAVEKAREAEEVAEQPAEEVPAEEAPAEEAPAEEAPAEEAPAEEAPAEEAPAEEAPAEEAPAEEAPAEEAPVEEAPAEEAPAEQEPVEAPAKA